MTTDKRHGFTWGKIVQIHRIGEFQIVEYHDELERSHPSYPEFEKVPYFHPFVSGKDTSVCGDTLEQALVIAISCKAKYPRAAEHIIRMLEM